MYCNLGQTLDLHGCCSALFWHPLPGMYHCSGFTTAWDVPLQQCVLCVQGWEDLRLDERLMQLVRTFAVILRSDPDTARRQLLPCPLSVTPLGASMGLIQWVDHTMPLYGVYKAWQHRQLTDKAGMLLHALSWLTHSIACCSSICLQCCM